MIRKVSDLIIATITVSLTKRVSLTMTVSATITVSATKRVSVTKTVSKSESNQSKTASVPMVYTVNCGASQGVSSLFCRLSVCACAHPQSSNIAMML